MRKKLTVICMIVVLLCLQVFSGTVVFGAEVSNNISIDSYDPTTENGGTIITDIYEGKPFELYVKCNNISNKVIENIFVDVSPDSSFNCYPTNDNLKVYNSSLSAGANKIRFDNPLKLTYKGSGNALILTFKYKIDGIEYSEEQIINISQIHPTPPSPAPTQNPPYTPATPQYSPKLETIGDNEIPTITAGTNRAITYQVKNNSIFHAKNVIVTLNLIDDSKTHLVLENPNLKYNFDIIKATETVPVSFNLKILKTAAEGLYPLKLNFHFNSPYEENPPDISETVYIRVKNDNIGPRLIVDNINVKQNESETSVINLELGLENIGNFAAKDVKVTLRGLKSGGLTAYNSTDVRYISKIGGDSTGTVSYQLLMPEKPVEGSNELTVKMDYRDEAGNTFTEENQIFVPLKESETVTEETKPSISFDNITAPQGTMAVNEDFEVSFDIINNGGSVAKNVKVSLATEKEVVVKSLSPVYFDKLDANAVKPVSFSMFISEEAITRNYPLAINIEYEDKSGQKYNASQYIGVYVEKNADNAGKTVPRIIVDKYSLDPSSVKAGEDFKLKMSFLNTSRTANVTNIKVTVASDDGTFTPTDSGNTFYVEDIPLKTSIERELLLHVKPDAEQKSYMLSVNFEYEDDKGNPYTTKETISVRVLQNPRLVTGELSLPPEAYVGQPLSLYLDFYNMGKSTLYNMMVKAVGDFKGQNLNYYVGNFEPGRTDYFDVSAIPSTAGELKGNVVFSFEDANGVVTEIKKEFTVNVMEMMKEGPMVDENGIPIEKGGIGMPGKMPGSVPANKFGIYIYIVPAVVIVAAVVTFIILRKRHIRRKEMTLDE